MSGNGRDPTPDEQAWFYWCRQLTCAACYRLGWDTPMQEQHHIIEGGRRVGHGASIPMCRPHHQPKGGGGPAVICRQLKCTEWDLMNDTVGRVMHLIRNHRGRLNHGN